MAGQLMHGQWPSQSTGSGFPWDLHRPGLRIRRPQRSDPSSLRSILEQLRPPGHLCSIFDTPQEQNAVVVPFIRIGLARGEKCIYIIENRRVFAFQEALRAGGVDVDRSMAANALMFVTTDQAYLKGGNFNPGRMFTFWRKAADLAKKQGFPALRFAAETDWFMKTALDEKSWLAYERNVSDFLSKNAILALCQYNGRRFPPELILDIVRTHPIVLYRGAVCRNFYYAPAAEFLAPHQVKRAVRRLLSILWEREQAEQELEAFHRRLLTLASRRDSAREEERRRNAREIHDQVGQILTVLRIDLFSLRKQQPARARTLRTKFEEMIRMADSALETVRRISSELRPALLDELGLAPAIEWELQEFKKRSHLRTRLQIVPPGLTLDRDRALALFRIFQESIANVLRHAEATAVLVRLAADKDTVTLEVSDNGKGVTDEQASDPQALGLLGMQERALRWDGQLRIRGRRGKGTMVAARIPLNDSRKGRI